MKKILYASFVYLMVISESSVADMGWHAHYIEIPLILGWIVGITISCYLSKKIGCSLLRQYLKFKTKDEL